MTRSTSTFCNFSQDNSSAARDACERLLAAFAPVRVNFMEIVRGEPGERG